MSYRLYVFYQAGEVPVTHSVLPIANLNGGFLVLLLLYLYPMEVVSPKWLTPQKALLLFLPWLIINFVRFVVSINFRTLSSFSEIFKYIGEFNVWFRLLVLFVCIVPYTVVLLRIPYKWQQNHVDRKWVYRYVVGEQGVSLFFCIYMLTGSVAVNCIHFFYSILFCLYITYQELFLRLFPSDVKVAAPTSVVVAAKPSTNPVEKPHPHVSNSLWENLTTLMDEKELWREPNISLEELASRLNSNRTTISALIQQQGHLSYSAFINRRRIKAFTETLNNNKYIDTLQLFYEVGFRSRSTALRNFRLYMGCTLNEYLQQTAGQEEKSIL